MTPAIYYVLRGDEGWIIRFNDRDYGHNSLTSALKAAISAARSSAEHGHEVQVLVQRPDKSWSVTWTSEDDFPPVAEAIQAEIETEMPAEPGAH
jgi:hypothetical protein